MGFFSKLIASYILTFKIWFYTRVMGFSFHVSDRRGRTGIQGCGKSPTGEVEEMVTGVASHTLDKWKMVRGVESGTPDKGHSLYREEGNCLAT